MPAGEQVGICPSAPPGTSGGNTYEGFGDGSDGPLYLAAPAVLTLTRDMNHTTVYIEAGATVKLSGFALNASVSFDNFGTIDCNGFDGQDGAAGVGGLGGFPACYDTTGDENGVPGYGADGGSAGGDGLLDSVKGPGGKGLPAGSGSLGITRPAPLFVGAGGGGGAAHGAAPSNGGNGQDVTGGKDAGDGLDVIYDGANAAFSLAGGGGGGGGGPVRINAKKFNNQGVIESRGGIGGLGQIGGADPDKIYAGYGGDGAPGPVLIRYRVLVNLGITIASVTSTVQC